MLQEFNNMIVEHKANSKNYKTEYNKNDCENTNKIKTERSTK